MRKEYEANEALAQACAQRRATDWTTPSPQRRHNDEARRIERSNKLADAFMVGLLIVTLAGIVSRFFG